jgi:hypothetical protein
MAAIIQRQGRYTLFETPDRNKILALGNDLWFAWVGGQQGELLVRSDSDHERERTLQEGEYYLVHFENDPSFTDLPHLFLGSNGAFAEVILPNGLPTDDDIQKRVVGTDKTVDGGTLKQHIGVGGSTIQDPPTRGSGDRELPIPDYDELSVRGAKVRLDVLNEDELRRLRLYEAENKKRKTLIHEIDRRLRAR